MGASPHKSIGPHPRIDPNSLARFISRGEREARMQLETVGISGAGGIPRQAVVPPPARHPPGTFASILRALRTVEWGVNPRDRAIITVYYALLSASKVLRPSETARRGVHPEFWIGDVTMETSIGKFRCRGGTTDFDIVNPNYEPRLADALTSVFEERSNQPFAFLDVGAHIGKFSVLAAKVLRENGTIIAVEPDPENFALLKENLVLNEAGNVRPRQMGCWSHDGVLPLHRRKTNLGGHSFMDEGGGETVLVPVRTVDHLLADEGIDRLDAIKIDVERAEAEVLRGARGVLEHSRDITVFFEETRDPETAESVRFLRSLGFEITRLAGITYVAIRATPARGHPLLGPN